MADLRISDDILSEWVKTMHELRQFFKERGDNILVAKVDRCRDIIENSEVLE